MRKYVALVGTNSKRSTNRQLLSFIKKHFSNNIQVELVELGGLPIFDKPRNMKIPPRAMDIADKIDKSDGVIISTPEYDHAAPAVLMNALEWLSYGIQPFMDKPVMITGASFGGLGTSRAQAHVRQMLDAPELRARIMPSSEYMVAHSLQAFDDDGQLFDQNNIEKLEGLIADFQEFVELNSHLKHNLNVSRLDASRIMTN
ncbi:NADPH-dependent FMN reductase [uncultured Secundilactobacillus sp.]|uniref:NADPH-dependent FMN reductase n=1 Tax=uncultured Secundilactobacillus sp. TaxID=2813935 RepID=UPI002587DE21|nr:NADPH-dependent FMN reductase [uncultured Secundilactobacillus sp.]